MNNYEIRIGKYVKQAWELFMKAPEVFVVSTLVYFVVVFAFARIPFIGTLINLIWAATFCPAMYLATDYVKREGKGSFDEMKKAINFMPQIAVFSIVSGIFMSIGFFLLVLPGIYLMVAYAFGAQIVVFKGKNFWEAMEESRKLVNKNWFGVFGLIIINSLILISGFLFLGVGGLISLPLSYLILYCAYADISEQLSNNPQVGA